MLVTTTAAETLHDAIEEAWARLPQRAETKAASDLAAAKFRSGAALFPDAPYSEGEYDDDRAGSNDNYHTTRVGVGTPLWLPGEGTATQRAASAEGRAALAGDAAAHLALAQQVLDLATRAWLAKVSRDVAQARLRSDQALSAGAADRFRVGEGAQSDALAADAAAQTDALDLNDADASLSAALLALSSLTGRAALPVLTVDRTQRADALVGNDADALVGNDADAIVGDDANAIERHPRIVAERQAVAAAEARERLVRLQDRADPELGLQVTNDKQPGSPWDTRLGVTFRVPFASAARNAPLRAAAAQEVTRAMVRLTLARREVAASLAEATLRQAAAERATLAADRAADDLQRRRQQIDRAWRVGEVPLIEAVRANAAAFEAELARDRARTQRDAAIQRLTLATGRLP